jgi:hypothetical protein
MLDGCSHEMVVFMYHVSYLYAFSIRLRLYLPCSAHLEHVGSLLPFGQAHFTLVDLVMT